MSDMQLRQTISQLSAYASPTPQPAHSKAYMKNLHTWSTTTTPPPKAPNTGSRSTRSRATRSSNLASAPQQPQPVYQPAVPIVNFIPAVPVVAPNPPRPPLPTATQALHSTYSSRLRTGATLLMQPIFASSSATGARTSTRRGGMINYADPGSGDDLPDAGALDSDDSDFVASGGTRTSIRQSRSRGGMKHKKDAVEWGVIGGDLQHTEAEGRDKSGAGLLKDKTGLGLGWGRAPKDGRGPKALKSVWRDWAEAEEFRTKFEVLSSEEVERREIERERASRRLRRETSKFQTTRSSRRVRY
ncbi:hypothetical protein DXG03_007691 [Asterophora parasitica]|uniref:Uncharacterized protein n=1 Tax=Asterophora parasitica TaxID=117018 RepID=A0A9P7G764_9AGAR|nr:hypothetical protein DXG03_007691 [Asterophora parasitica]